MKNTILLTLFVSFLTLSLSAQRWKRYRHEVIVGIGATNFLGELGGGKGAAQDLFLDFDGKASRYCFMGGYRYKLNEYTSLRPTVTYARLYGSDEFSGDLFRRSRNLKFRTPLVELALVGEFYFIPEKVSSRYRLRGIKGALGSSFSAYAFGGVAGFWFNPRGEYDGTWYSLQPIGTEGQGLNGTPKYKRIGMGIPFGLGAKLNITHTTSISIEYGFRYTFSDYLDDVSTTYYDPAAVAAANGSNAAAAAYLTDPSIILPGEETKRISTLPGQQRGDPTTKDTYMFAVVGLNYKFVTRKTNRPKF